MQIYGDRPLAVSGTLSGVDLDMSDDPVAKLETSQLFSVQAQFDKERGVGLGQYDKGDQVTVVCSELSEVMGVPMLDDCYLPR